MPHSDLPPLKRPDLRKQMQQKFVLIDELFIFFMDYFPEFYRKLNLQRDRTEMESDLLQQIELVEIQNALHQHEKLSAQPTASLEELLKKEISRPALRAVLIARFPQNKDLRAFIVDHFPEVDKSSGTETDPRKLVSRLLWDVQLARVQESLLGGSTVKPSDSQPSEVGGAKAAGRSSDGLYPSPQTNFVSKFYLSRPAEEQTFTEALALGSQIVIKGPLGFGKTWFLQHIAELLRQQGHQVILCDMDLFRRFFTKLEDLVQSLIDHIVQHLSTKQHSSISQPGSVSPWPLRAFSKFLSDRITATGSKLTLIIDNADVVSGTPCQDGFYGLMRSLAVAVETNRPSIVLSVSTSPAKFIRDPNISPFNAYKQIELQAFDEAQILQLASYHGLTLTAEDLAAIHKWLAGHPLMVDLVLHEARRSLRTPQAILEALEQSASESIFKGFLDRLRTQLLSGPSPERRLYRAFEDLIEGDRDAVDKMDSNLLELAGLIVWDAKSGRFQVRHRVYELLLRGRKPRPRGVI